MASTLRRSDSSRRCRCKQWCLQEGNKSKNIQKIVNTVVVVMMRVKVPVMVVVLMLLLLMMIVVLAGMTVTMVTTVRNGLVGVKDSRCWGR